jgi:hypothetical protein
MIDAKRTIGAILATMLLGCARGPCPSVEIPNAWREPPYKHLDPGFVKDGPVCMSVEDARKLIENQAICDAYRLNALDLLDALK